MIEVSYEDTWRLMVKEQGKADELLFPSVFVKYIGGLIVTEPVLLKIFTEILAHDHTILNESAKRMNTSVKSEDIGITKDELRKKFKINPADKKTNGVSYISIKIIDKHIAYLSGATLIMYYKKGKQKKYILTARGCQVSQFLTKGGYIDIEELVKRHNMV